MVMMTAKGEPLHDNFDSLYVQAIREVLADLPVATELPTLEDVKTAIRDSLDGEGLFFAGLEEFFEWWDVTTAYDQMDEGEPESDYKPLLSVAYQALVAEETAAMKQTRYPLDGD